MNTRPCALITSTSAPFCSLVEAGALARRAGREIDGPEQAVVTLDEYQRLALVADVIAGGHHVGAGVEQLGQDRLGDAEAAGGVLAVHHHEIGAVALAQSGQRLDRPPRGPSGRPSRPGTEYACLPPIRSSKVTLRASIQNRGARRQLS